MENVTSNKVKYILASIDIDIENIDIDWIWHVDECLSNKGALIDAATRCEDVGTMQNHRTMQANNYIQHNYKCK